MREREYRFVGCRCGCQVLQREIKASVSVAIGEYIVFSRWVLFVVDLSNFSHSLIKYDCSLYQSTHYSFESWLSIEILSIVFTFKPIIAIYH